MRSHKNTKIPEELWIFFSTQPGLSTDQLIRVIDQKISKYPLFTLTQNFGMIVLFKGYELIKFYLSQPSLSVDELLQYHAYTIRNFICHDKDFKFHKWLIKHNLKIPTKVIISEFSHIDLFSSAGIEYLTRKILSNPPELRQQALNALMGQCPSQLEKDMAEILADSLVGKGEAVSDSVRHRYDRFKHNRLITEEKLAVKYASGIHSLKWQAAKKVAAILDEDKKSKQNIELSCNNNNNLLFAENKNPAAVKFTKNLDNICNDVQEVISVAHKFIKKLA